MKIALQRSWRDAAPKAKRVFIPGNHEDRLRRFIWRNPDIYGLRAMELKNLLELDILATVIENDVSYEQVLISGIGNSRLAHWRGKEYRSD